MEVDGTDVDAACTTHSIPGRMASSSALVKKRSSNISDPTPVEVWALFSNIEDRHLVAHTAKRNDDMGANEAISSGQKVLSSHTLRSQDL
ncbi:MAG: hypothetical protein KatS3mg082_2776 [Nitrospiraceae bacterium]|nr:MAG: hypothetical protein KatS3mg082_2776 [Nitrospiraceae bacterium]